MRSSTGIPTSVTTPVTRLGRGVTRAILSSVAGRVAVLVVTFPTVLTIVGLPVLGGVSTTASKTGRPVGAVLGHKKLYVGSAEENKAGE